MNLVIVESRSKIKTIEKILGKDFKVFASSGHVDNLPKKELGIDIENNFKPKYLILADKKKNLQQLSQECQKANLVWLATDKDFEGERIAEALRKHCSLKKFNRVYFTEITPKAILESFKNPVSHLNQGFLDCQETRRILDRLIGYKLSPILWKHFPMNSKKPISIGRVQSATLAIVMNRELLIKQFESQKKWVINGYFMNAEKTAIQSVLCPELKTKENVLQVLNNLVGKFSTKCLESKITKKNPSKPFITSTLQQASFQQLHFPIQKTMKLAQELYEKGHITYLRTDSCQLSNDFIEMASEYIISTFGNEYLQSILRVVKNRGNAQEAHEAIRPTRMNKKISMTPEHQKLYSLIWKRALGFLMSPAEFYDTELQIRDSSFNESMYFKTVISTCLFTGFMILDEKTSVTKKEAKKKLDLWQTVDCEKIIGFEKYQNPPNHFDESTLVKEMEQAGVGRPATYQASIDKLIDKKYIEKKNFQGFSTNITKLIWKNRGSPLNQLTESINVGQENNKLGITELGANIIKFLKDYFPFIINVDFTKDMEQSIDDILNNKTRKLEILKEFYKTFQPLLTQTIQNGESVKKISNDISQIKVGRKIYHIKEGPFGFYVNFKENNKTKNISLGAYLQFMNKSLDQIKEADIKLLIQLPIEYKSGYTIEYGRYGFYSRQEKLDPLQIKQFLMKFIL